MFIKTLIRSFSCSSVEWTWLCSYTCFSKLEMNNFVLHTKFCKWGGVIKLWPLIFTHTFSIVSNFVDTIIPCYKILHVAVGDMNLLTSANPNLFFWTWTYRSFGFCRGFRSCRRSPNACPLGWEDFHDTSSGRAFCLA